MIIKRSTDKSVQLKQTEVSKRMASVEMGPDESDGGLNVFVHMFNMTLACSKRTYIAMIKVI
jgi:hypothetical protein